MGVSSIREFAAPLMVGIVCGAYSSVCITGPLWLVMKRHFRKAGVQISAADGNSASVEMKTGRKEKAADEKHAETRNKNGKKQPKKKNRKRVAERLAAQEAAEKAASQEDKSE